MTTIREVNPARLAFGSYDHAKNDYRNEGDIPASYSGDCIALGLPVRKPFRLDGELWITIGLNNRGASAYRLCPLRIFTGSPTTYRDKSGTAECAETARNDPDGFYHHITVKHGGQEFVLSAPKSTSWPANKRMFQSPRSNLRSFNRSRFAD